MSKTSEKTDPRLSDLLLDWYDRERRDLPWRAPPGAPPTEPYKVWLSEIMLQQTTVAAVIPYYRAFLERWPTVVDLAKAETDDVLAAWAGLGYYARARNLKKCADHVAQWRDGAFPRTEEALRDLPGVGAYTAAAIAAIAYGQKAVVVDGNVERVMARLFAETAPLPSVKKALKAHAASLTPEARCGDYAQGVMDLGATVCTPRNPACGLCPWMQACEGRKQGIAETLPTKAPKKEKPTRRGIAYWVRRADGKVLLRRRPAEGLLGGMLETPNSEWREGPMPSLTQTANQAPLQADWRLLPGLVRHTFTHFHLELNVAVGDVGRSAKARGVWVDLEAFPESDLPTVMRKVARHALKKAY